MNRPMPFMDENVLNADCLVALKAMPDACVDMCLTSPPYWGLRDYGVEGQLGQESTPQKFVSRLCDVMDEVWRVMKPTGGCWVNLRDTYGKGRNEVRAKCLALIPSRFAVEMTDRGWILRNELIWWKSNAMTESMKDRFTVDFEKVFFFVKSKNYYFQQQFEPRVNGNGTRNQRCVWNINTNPFKGAHFAVCPEKLCEIPIIAGCPPNGIVLDPFAGAGTTLLVAKKLGRRYVGIELNPKFCRLIQDRLKGAAIPEVDSKTRLRAAGRRRRVRDSGGTPLGPTTPRPTCTAQAVSITNCPAEQLAGAVTDLGPTGGTRTGDVHRVAHFPITISAEQESAEFPEEKCAGD